MSATRVPSFAADCVLGLLSHAVGLSRRGGRVLGRVGGPVTATVTAPLHEVVRPLAVRGRTEREAAVDSLRTLVEAVTPPLVDSVLDQLDLTDLVLRHVDLERLAAVLPYDDIVDRVDVERVLGRLDLAGIVREVLDELDLPEIIRESTGTMTSETVRSVRMQGIDADARVSHLVDRLLPRRGMRRTEVGPDGEAVVPQVAPPLPGQRHDETLPERR